MVSERLADALVACPSVFAHCGSYAVFYFATGRLEEDYLVPQPKRVDDDVDDAKSRGKYDCFYSISLQISYVRNRTVSVGYFCFE